jgi:Ca-activated chloride channel homolog
MSEAPETHLQSSRQNNERSSATQEITRRTKYFVPVRFTSWLVGVASGLANKTPAFVRENNRLQQTALMGLPLITLALLIGAAPLTTHSQSGRQKGPAQSPTPNSNSRPRQTTKSNTQAAAKTNPNESSDEAEEVIRVTSNLVPVPATVVDARGVAVTSLKLEDFELIVDGQPGVISDISRAESPVRMAMLFDNSGSLSESRDFEKRAAIRFFHNVLRPIDQAAVFSVSTDVTLAEPLTDDARRLESTIAGFGKPEGATSLFDAIIQSSNYLRPYKGRRIIVIVSDGEDTTSRADFDTTLNRALADDSQIYVVQTGLYENANVRALAAERRMEELSVQTGGAVYIPKSAEDLDSAFAQIAADLAQQYILSYYPGVEKRDGKYHVLSVRVKTNPNARVRARKGFLVKTRDRV